MSIVKNKECKIIISALLSNIKSDYVTITSMLQNKNITSVYHIYIVVRTEERRFYENLLSLNSKQVMIEIVSHISEIGNQEVEALALPANSIILTDLCNCTGDKMENWISQGKIIVFSKEDSAELYFDGKYSELWFRYYMLSLYSEVPVERVSGCTFRCLGNKPEPDDINIAVYLEELNFKNIRNFIDSISENIDLSRKVSFHIMYRNLSYQHQQELAECTDSRITICLYCVNNIRIMHWLDIFLSIAPQMDNIKKKFLLLSPNLLCTGDFSELYDSCLDKGELAAVWTRTFQDEILDWNNLIGIRADILACMIDLEKWRNEDIYGIIHIKMSMENVSTVTIEQVLELSDNYRIGNILKYQDFFVEQEQTTVQEDELEYMYDIDAMLEEKQKLQQEIQKLQEKNQNLQLEKERYLYELTETRKSFTYRIGKMITFIPRKLARRK